MKEQRRDKYWICSDCAKAKQWKCVDRNVTTIHGLCGYCESPEKQMLTPIVDFKRGDVEPVWD